MTAGAENGFFSILLGSWGGRVLEEFKIGKAGEELGDFEEERQAV